MTPRDIYNRLLTYKTREDDAAPILAYGLIEGARFRWIESKERKGQPPTDKEISEWLADFDVDEVLERARRMLRLSTKSKTYPQRAPSTKAKGKGGPPEGQTSA